MRNFIIFSCFIYLSLGYIIISATDKAIASSFPKKIRVSLSAAAPAGGVTLKYATADSSAVAGTDYTAASGTVSWAQGEINKVIYITLTPRSTGTTKQFLIKFTKPTGEQIGASGKTSKTETVTIYPSTQSSGITNDPVIRGFQGQQFIFEGEDGAVYQMFSSASLAINERMTRYYHQNNSYGHIYDTYATETSLMTKNDKIRFTVGEAMRGDFEWNGETVHLDASRNFLDLGDCVQLTWAPTSVMISSSTFELVYAFRKPVASDGHKVPYLNLKFVHIDSEYDSFGGVVGQTAFDELPIDEDGSHFKASSIFSVDSAKNTFTNGLLKCGSKRSADFGSFHSTVEQLKYENPNS